MMRMRNWGFSFTVIDGRRNDGRVSLRIGEEMKDLDGMRVRSLRNGVDMRGGGR